MGWLHTWCGLVAGWLLCAIFLTGTLSVFRAPITRWMEARPLVAAGDTRAALHQAAEHLAAQASGARFWRIELPQQPGDALLLAWQPAGGGRGSQQAAAMDPGTGALLPRPWGRKTEGGRHFMTFHYTLHGGIPGFWLVGWLAMCMLVALVSGVVVHRRIFADFFTFRPGKGQRSWLDAHNATAVLALPFLLMIAYTGLAFFYASYVPWPLRSVYGTDGKAYERFQSELSHHAAAPRPAPQGTPAALHDLPPLLEQAQALTGQPARMLVVERPGDASMAVRVYSQPPQDARTLLGTAGDVLFDGVSGAVLQVRRPDPDAPYASEQIHKVLEALHVASFGGWTIRWLYFFCGWMGTAMMATGTLLFMVKRRQKSGMEFGAATLRAYRTIEALNVAHLAGIALASIGYLWINRLLPADLPGREAWEIRGFLLVWLASLLHAALRSVQRAWVEQLGLASALCVGLPLLNLATTGQHVARYAQAGDWQRAGVELVALGLGAVMACIALQVHGSNWRRGVSARAHHARPGATSARYRLGIASRVLAACGGGYGVACLAACALAAVLPLLSGASRADGVLIASLLAFVFYTVVAIWVFSTRSVARAWLGLAGVALACAGVMALAG